MVPEHRPENRIENDVENKAHSGFGRASEGVAAVRANVDALLSKENRPPSVTILKTADEIYAFLRDFTNYPKFVKGIVSVTPVSDKISHWVSGSDGSIAHEWDSELVIDDRGSLLAWHNLASSTFKQNGSVSLEPTQSGRGTIVRMKVTYEKPLAKFIGAIASFVGQDPDAEGAMNLRRLKAYLETGEVPTVEGQPSGRDADSAPTKH